MQVEETEERIDLEALKVKERIFFYDELVLFEDELADNGVALLNVKIVRCYHGNLTPDKVAQCHFLR